MPDLDVRSEILDVVQDLMAKTGKIFTDKPADYEGKLVVIGAETAQAIETLMDRVRIDGC